MRAVYSTNASIDELTKKIISKRSFNFIPSKNKNIKYFLITNGDAMLFTVVIIGGTIYVDRIGSNIASQLEVNEIAFCFN